MLGHTFLTAEERQSMFISLYANLENDSQFPAFPLLLQSSVCCGYRLDHGTCCADVGRLCLYLCPFDCVAEDSELRSF